METNVNKILDTIMEEANNPDYKKRKNEKRGSMVEKKKKEQAKGSFADLKKNELDADPTLKILEEQLDEVLLEQLASNFNINWVCKPQRNNYPRLPKKNVNNNNIIIIFRALSKGIQRLTRHKAYISSNFCSKLGEFSKKHLNFLIKMLRCFRNNNKCSTTLIRYRRHLLRTN